MNTAYTSMYTIQPYIQGMIEIVKPANFSRIHVYNTIYVYPASYTKRLVDCARLIQIEQEWCQIAAKQADYPLRWSIALPTHCDQD